MPLIEFRDTEGNLVGQANVERAGWHRIPSVIVARLLPVSDQLIHQLVALETNDLIGLFQVMPEGGQLKVVMALFPAAQAQEALALNENAPPLSAYAVNAGGGVGTDSSVLRGAFGNVVAEGMVAGVESHVING
jgi:hypothetical protein